MKRFLAVLLVAGALFASQPAFAAKAPCSPALGVGAQIVHKAPVQIGQTVRVDAEVSTAHAGIQHFGGCPVTHITATVSMADGTTVTVATDGHVRGYGHLRFFTTHIVVTTSDISGSTMTVSSHATGNSAGHVVSGDASYTAAAS